VSGKQDVPTEVQQAKPLVPQWTLEDFMSEKPYAYLYAYKDKKFLLQQMLNRAQAQAKALKFSGFMRMWNSYVEANSPKQTILGDYQTMFPEQPLQLRSGHYNCDEFGVSYTGRMGESVTVCSHPIMPVMRVVNLDSKEEKMQIAFRRGSKQKEWSTPIISKDVLASSQKIISLARQGVAVNSENAKDLVSYLTDMESMNYDEIPTQNSTGHLGWLPDGQFSPYCEGVVYDGDNPEFKRIFDGFRETGSESVWMGIAKATRSGKSVPARLALAASFAAPLVSILNALPFFVHIWGTQGCGKTVGLMLAASVWGNPEVGKYIKTFGGTKVSQELYASFCGNVPIILDELQIMADRKSFDDIIYMLCEGVSKGRGAKDGGLQLQRHWSSTIITSAEMPIVQSNSGGGAAVRTIEVNYGGEPLFEDSRTVAETLKQNYGFAGRKFIESLKDPETLQALRDIQKRYYSQLSGEIQDKQVLAASILLAADKLADAALFHDGKALTVEEIKPYLITRDQADVNVRAYNWLCGYIAGNPRRFDANEENPGEVWGVIESGICYFNRTFFDRVMHAEAFSPSSFLTWADRNGKIIREYYGKNSGNNRMTVRKKVGGAKVACVALLLPTDDDKAPVPVMMTPVQDDDMPF